MEHAGEYLEPEDQDKEEWHEDVDSSLEGEPLIRAKHSH